MLGKYIVFFIFTLLVNALFSYYIIAFSALYGLSSVGMVYSALICLILDYLGIAIFIAVYVTMTRSCNTSPECGVASFYSCMVIRIFFQ